MMMLTRKYECEAAHQLSAGVPEGHPCRRLHGHRYEIEVAVSSLGTLKDGMIAEYAELDALLAPIIDLIDHRYLNRLGCEVRHVTLRDLDVLQWKTLAYNFKVPTLANRVRENSTVEHLAAWLVREIQEVLLPNGLGFVSLQIREDSRSVVTIRSGE